MTPELVTQALTSFSDFLMKYFLALAAVGALTMALLEAYKTIFDSRTKFHFNFLKRFIDSDQEAQRTSKDINTACQVHNTYSDTFSELIHLISGIEVEKARSLSYEKKDGLLTVFSLEVANMMGKIQDAVDAAIDNPKRYPNLFIFATSGADTADAIKWIEIANSPSGCTDSAIMKTRSELYTRLHQLAKRKLDRLQMQITYRWTNLNQLCANLLGIFILFVTLLWVNREKALDPGDYLIIFLASAIGGIFAPIAKDMISWLQKVKTRG